MRESTYQGKLIKKLGRLYPGCVVIKQDPGYMQGVLDLLFLHGTFWALLEAKASAEASYRPNQEYYIEMFNNMSFAARIHPGNEEEVLRALQFAYESRGNSRVS